MEFIEQEERLIEFVSDFLKLQQKHSVHLAVDELLISCLGHDYPLYIADLEYSILPHSVHLHRICLEYSVLHAVGIGNDELKATRKLTFTLTKDNCVEVGVG